MRLSSVMMFFPSQPRFLLAAGLGLCALLSAGAPAPAELDPQPSPPLVPTASTMDEGANLDVLVFNDGDQVRGRLVERSPDLWLFRSERFGLLRVPIADATVTLSDPESVAAEARARAEAAEPEAPRGSIFSPGALAKDLGDFFGPWHGRFTFSSQLMQSSTDTSNTMLEAKLQRKWQHDNVKLDARYDYIDTDDVTTTDIIKGDAAWRHDFRNRWFSIYSPSLEWNRAYTIDDVPSDYILLQQEFGVGYTVTASRKSNLRVGVAENVFDVWETTAPESHNSKTAESVFLEADWKLPWRMTLTERGSYYYSIASQIDGWENKLELDKKLTETFAVGIRYETRQNDPGVRVQDYTLTKFYMGVDF